MEITLSADVDKACALDDGKCRFGTLLLNKFYTLKAIVNIYRLLWSKSVRLRCFEAVLWITYMKKNVTNYKIYINSSSFE